MGVWTRDWCKSESTNGSSQYLLTTFIERSVRIRPAGKAKLPVKYSEFVIDLLKNRQISRINTNKFAVDCQRSESQKA